jgi:polyhydroxyalkanoate synthesis regulator phasin
MSEEIKKISVSEMLRTTGTNTADFMAQVANHIEVLEQRIANLEELLKSK